ncbi:leukotriene B4 receptor 1-like [Hoplias malabaricus]|uniref:leukotriene B4 receptor 1-like n=1 Tax=Hoplias malabaricus TaxID=27720 RepID=UPI0034620CB9
MQHGNSSNSSTPLSPDILAASSVLGLCFALGVPGNIAVLVLISRWLKGGSFTSWLMLSLAVSDLMTLLPLPIWIYALLHDWVFGLGLCKLFSYVVYLSIYSSVLCVTLLSVQRYVQVLHPQKLAKLTARGRKCLVSGIWILSGVLACYAPIQRHVQLKQDGRLYCHAHYRNNGERLATLFVETLVLFVVPFPILIYFYVRLHHGVSQSAFFNTHKLTKIVSRILFTFLFFWIPLHVNNFVLIAALLLDDDHLLKIAEAVGNTTGALTFINSSMNPFIYAFSARALRQRTPRDETT